MRISPSKDSAQSECCTVHEYVTARIKAHGRRIAQVDALTGEFLTFDVLLERSMALSVGLLARGLRAGEVALVIGQNSIHYPWVLLGVLKTGASAHLINSGSTAREVEHAASISRPAMVLVTEAVFQQQSVTTVLRESPSVRHILVWKTSGSGSPGQVSRDLPEGISLEELTVTPQDVTGGVVDVLPQTASGSSVALILQSSGTTGMPKSVMLSHENVLAALTIGPAYVLEEDMVVGLSPFSHAYGAVVMLMALCAGAAVASIQRFSMDGLLLAVEKHKITVMHIVSPLLVSIAKLPPEDLNRLRSMRRIWTAGARMPPSVHSALQSRLPGVTLGHCYGMTETTFCVLSGVVLPHKPGSTGPLMEPMEAKIVDLETGNQVSAGSRGELRLRGPMVMRGYLRNPEATAAAIDAEGWLRTGDIVHMDDDGHYYIVDRDKHVFKYNGHQVSPTELEMVLMGHPAVSEAAVIGEPHEYGEVPRALVVLAEGHQVTAEELQSFVADRVAPHKRLRGGITFLRTPLPRTASGKVQHAKLRTLLSNSSVVRQGDLEQIGGMEQLRASTN